MKVVIAGGSGQVGTILARHFHGAGHTVVVLSRHLRDKPWRTVYWDGVSVGAWTEDLDRSDVLINLSGRSVNCRYTERNRKEILESRVFSTRVLHCALRAIESPPALWLNASTATIYRHAVDRPMDEKSGELGGEEAGVPSTWRFSITVAKSWEQEFFSTPTSRTRKVALRSAMIFSPDKGGVFDAFSNLVRFGFGGVNLPGTQFVSWIHEADFLRAIEFLIATPSLEGPVNLASPHPLPNREFLRSLRETWRVPIGLPTWPLTLELGAFLLRTESELVLKSRRVVPGRLLQAGFQFSYDTWPQAAAELVARMRKSS